MTRAEIEQQLIEIVRKEKRNLPADLVFDSSTELTGAGIDSLDSLSILFAIEEQFSITIPDTVARAMKTFGDIVDAVAAELKVSN